MPMPETTVDSDPPWFNRMTKMMGLYEYPGDADNPEIIKMALVRDPRLFKLV